MAKYLDIAEIGSGGFGKVYACRCFPEGGKYAKKKLDVTADSDALKRFAREVRTLSALDHPHIVKVVAKKLENPPFFLYNAPLPSNFSVSAWIKATTVEAVIRPLLPTSTRSLVLCV